jgi:hypothetical protein
VKTLNFSLILKILIIFLLVFSVNANAQTMIKKDLTDITIEYQKEILIEKGWTKYISFSVNNSGDSDLYDINVFVDGIFPDWFEFQNNRVDVLKVGEKVEFVTKISVPYDIETGDYKFSLNIESNKINYKTDFTVRVFESREDVLLYQIQSLRDDLSELEKEADKIEASGLNLTSARDIFFQIKSDLDSAENQVHNKMYTDVTETIKDVENLFIKARFEVSNPHSTPKEEPKNLIDISFQEIYFYSSGIGVIILLISLIYLVRKVKIENKVRLPNLRLKELIIENRRLKELEREIEKTKESQKIIETEYKENMISKESYDELRLKYQERILELEAEKKKARGY